MTSDPTPDGSARGATPRTSARTSAVDSEFRGLDRTDLGGWLAEHSGVLASRWLLDVDARAGGLEPEVKALLGEFFDELLVLLPACLGPYRAQVEPYWRQCAELYGSVGAMRGLAAGEIIDEFQLLREATLRLMFATPPSVRGTPMLLREVLRLNRVIDRGVTFANVGHTDALFFALFHGTGVPTSLASDQLEEVRDQLGTLRGEVRRILAHLRT
ncbi:MAG: hypothetical protein R3E10_00310 [Gemmatimonadota bacterium]